jgi:hypothetical protein
MGEGTRVSHICLNQLFTISLSKCMSFYVHVYVHVNIRLSTFMSVSTSAPENVHKDDTLKGNTSATVNYWTSVPSCIFASRKLNLSKSKTTFVAVSGSSYLEPLSITTATGGYLLSKWQSCRDLHHSWIRYLLASSPPIKLKSALVLLLFFLYTSLIPHSLFRKRI